MTSKLEYNKKKKILAIVQAAEEVFCQKPYSSITVDEIAARAGVTKRTLYSYFPSKLALFTRISEECLQALNKEVLEAIGQDLPVDKLIKEAVGVLFRFTQKNEKFMRLFWTLDSEEYNGQLPDDLVQGIKLWNRGMIENMTELIKRGQKEGAIAPCDPELLVHLFSAMNKGIFIHANKEGKFNIASIPAQGLQELLLELIDKGLFQGRD